jgi:AraC-like DNA-binding protein
MFTSCSVRLVQPFMKFAGNEHACRDLVPDDFWSLHPDDRVSVDTAHDMLGRGIERTRDELLGLRLGRMMTLGAGGPFDYVVHTAATVRDSLNVAAKYSRVLADSFRVSFEIWGERAFAKVHDENDWPRPAADFAMSAMYKLHLSEQLPPSQIECWFPYAAPSDPTEYEHIFPGASLKFGAPFHGFAFDRSLADLPIPGADAELHAILKARVDALMAEHFQPPSFATVVRRLLSEQIPAGNPSAEHIARIMRMSRRTLSRRLEHERTSFNSELDAVRRRLAFDQLGNTSVPLSEVAFLAGFSHVESFHRAFKRWTGQTPLTYRATHAQKQS